MIVLVFYTESGIDGSYLLLDFLLGIVSMSGHAQSAPKQQIANILGKS